METIDKAINLSQQFTTYRNQISVAKFKYLTVYVGTYKTVYSL